MAMVAVLSANCSAATPERAKPAAAASTNGVQVDVERAPAQSSEPVVPGRTLLDTKGMTLNEMIDMADRIFLGTVKRVDVGPTRLQEGDQATTADVRTVTVSVTEGIKKASNGQEITIRQLASISSPVAVGDEVFWFLASDSSLGLTQPLGVFSGDFRIENTPEGKRVRNLRGNTGLWDGSLWTGDGFVRNDVLEEAREMKLPQTRIRLLDQSGARNPEQNNGIPLDLLLAATRSQLK